MDDSISLVICVKVIERTMNQKWYLVVLFASFAICGVIASTVPENSVRDSLADQRVRTFTDADKIPDRNWTTLSEALDLFDVRYLAKNWTEGKYPVQEQCAKDITRYIKGLKNHEDWAIKGTSNWSNFF